MGFQLKSKMVYAISSTGTEIFKRKSHSTIKNVDQVAITVEPFRSGHQRAAQIWPYQQAGHIKEVL